MPRATATRHNLAKRKKPGKTNTEESSTAGDSTTSVSLASIPLPATPQLSVPEALTPNSTQVITPTRHRLRKKQAIQPSGSTRSSAATPPNSAPTRALVVRPKRLAENKVPASPPTPSNNVEDFTVAAGVEQKRTGVSASSLFGKKQQDKATRRFDPSGSTDSSASSAIGGTLTPSYINVLGCVEAVVTSQTCNGRRQPTLRYNTA